MANLLSRGRVKAWVALFFAASSALRVSAATPPPQRDPFAPPMDQVLARFETIQQEVARLYISGQASAAQVMAAELVHFQDQLSAAVPSAIQEPELDIVSIYEAIGGASVELTVKDRPVTLALCSYRSTSWTLTLGPGVNLQKVILASYEDGGAVNVPAGVPVIALKSYIGRRVDYGSYPAGERLLRSTTGNTQVTSMFGVYDASTSVALVGPGNGNWRAQRVLREMQPLYLSASEHQRSVQQDIAAPVRFGGLSQKYTVNAYGFISRKSSVAQLSIFGELSSSAVPLTKPYDNSVVLPGGQTAYAENTNSVVAIDLATGLQSDIPVVGSGLPDTSWICGIAYDSQRSRVVISTLGGQGYLYSNTPGSSQWTLISSLQNVDLQSLAYIESTDTLYGLPVKDYSSDNGRYTLKKYDSNGNFIGELLIGEVIPSTTQPGLAGMQLMAAGGQLALLTPPTPDLYQLDQPDQMRLFLIDPKSGAVTYSGVFPAVPEPSMGLVMSIVLGGIARRTRLQAPV